RHGRHLAGLKDRRFERSHRRRRQIVELSTRLHIPKRDLAHAADNGDRTSVAGELCLHRNFAWRDGAQFASGLNVPDLELGATRERNWRRLLIFNWSIQNGKHRTVRTKATAHDLS